MESNILLAFLTHKLNLTPKKLAVLDQFYPTIQDAVTDNFAKINPTQQKWITRWNEVPDYLEALKKFEDTLNLSSVQILSCFDNDYPKKLKDLGDYPIVLYYQGNLGILQNNLSITVVGSRNYTKYAELALTKILTPLCVAGVNVISGLAVGIDGLSHRLALENKSPTLGVIGSGLDDSSFYPSQHIRLKKEMIESDGLVFSEYPPGTKPAPFTFPARNRILAALSPVTLVVQANQKSGSLITAREALEIGRQVATIPGSILDTNFSGNTKLLKQGANLIADSGDLLELLGVNLQLHSVQNLFESPQSIEFNNPQEELIYKNLGLEPQNIQLISEKLKLDINLLSGHLTMLEISGLAANLGENNWIRCG